ncbi:hypothetical protein KI387_021429, partial [Taxus chinensis]
YAQNIEREWRLASVEEVRRNLGTIKEKRILDSWDIARLLDGWVDGPGYRYSVRNEYKPVIGHMLLVKTRERRPDDVSFEPKIYSGVELNGEGRKAALLLSCEDKITDVICFVLHSILQSFTTPQERQAELDRLTTSLKDEFRNGKTVLHYVTDQPHNSKHAEYVAKLLRREFEYGKELIKDADKDRRTALHLAALHGHTDLCKSFIENCEMKADDKDRNGENLLHFAVNSNNVRVVGSLFKFLNTESIICSHDAKGKTALHKAAANGNEEMMKFLLSRIDERRLKIYIQRADLFGQTALHVAASAGHKDAVKYLLDGGSRPLHERDTDGKTALHYAVQLPDQGKAIEVAKLLLQYCRDDEERSLLLWASATGVGTAELACARSLEVQDYLKQIREEAKKSTNDLLRSAIKLEDDKMAWELINRGAKTNHITNFSGNDWSEQEKQRVRT